jgi:hypothetical protein
MQRARFFQQQGINPFANTVHSLLAAMMPITTTHTLTLADAQHALALLSSLVEWRQANLPADQGMAFCVPEPEWPADLGVDAELLLLVLPDKLAPLLSDLATKTFDIANDISADLLTSTTLLTLSSERTSVEVNGWTCKLNPSVQSGKFYVALVAAERFALVCHDLGAQDMDAFLGGWQGACASSGPNYRPHRIWSQDQLDAAARGEDVLGLADSDQASPSCERTLWRVTCHTVTRRSD